MQLTQKEKELLKDLKGQEKLCVEKYSQHAAAANDEQLSQLLNYLGGVEQRHLDIITKIDSGEIPQPAVMRMRLARILVIMPPVPTDVEESPAEAMILASILCTTGTNSAVGSSCGLAV